MPHGTRTSGICQGSSFSSAVSPYYTGGLELHVCIQLHWQPSTDSTDPLPDKQIVLRKTRKLGARTNCAPGACAARGPCWSAAWALGPARPAAAGSPGPAGCRSTRSPPPPRARPASARCRMPRCTGGITPHSRRVTFPSSGLLHADLHAPACAAAACLPSLHCYAKHASRHSPPAAEPPATEACKLAACRWFTTQAASTGAGSSKRHLLQSRHACSALPQERCGAACVVVTIGGLAGAPAPSRCSPPAFIAASCSCAWAPALQAGLEPWVQGCRRCIPSPWSRGVHRRHTDKLHLCSYDGISNNTRRSTGCASESHSNTEADGSARVMPLLHAILSSKAHLRRYVTIGCGDIPKG
jgi:hypothetical protein